MFTINLKKFLFTVAFCLSFIGGTAQTGNGSHGNSTTTTTRSLLRVISKGLDRKRARSRVYIEIQYTNGYIFLNSNQEGLVLNIEFENCLTGNKEIIPIINVGEYISIELESGYYEMTAKSSDGDVFYGEINVY